MSVHRICLQRGSPYFADAGRLALEPVKPLRVYSAIYPQGVDVSRLAVFFEHRMRDVVSDADMAETREWIDTWKAMSRSTSRPQLTYVKSRDFVVVWDKRDLGAPKTHRLGSLEAFICELCTEDIRDELSILSSVGELEGSGAAQEARIALDFLCREGLLLSERKRYFGLAIPANPNWKMPAGPSAQPPGARSRIPLQS